MPAQILGYGAPLGALVIKTLPQTLRSMANTRTQIGYSAFLFSGVLSNWSYRYHPADIRGALDRLAAQTGQDANPVETSLVVPVSAPSEGGKGHHTTVTPTRQN